MRRAASSLVLLAACGLTGCGTHARAEPVVTVLGSWTGDEEKGFQAILDGFREKHPGIQVHYTGTRDADAVLASDLKDGNPPDLAVLATPGELRQDAAAGRLAPIEGSLGLKRMAIQYGPGWRGLMQAAGPSGTRHYYAIIVKAALKSVIWYDPEQFPARYISTLTRSGLTWSQLTGLAKGLRTAGGSPWCMGMEDSSNSGWPGTDWIEDIVLHQSGPRVYDQWVAGKLPWTSGPITRAWRTFGQVADTPGFVDRGIASALVTTYERAGQPMFASRPGCYLDHEGSFITGFYAQDKLGARGGRHAHPRPVADFKFIPFPRLTSAGRDSAEVGGDLLGMFRSTSAARQLIAYLTTPAAQEAWIRRPGSGAMSVNRLVPLSDYPDPLSHDLASDLLSAVTVRFDASDSMPQVLESAFNDAVLEYLDDPGQLNIILRGLDQVRRAVY